MKYIKMIYKSHENDMKKIYKGIKFPTGLFIVTPEEGGCILIGNKDPITGEITHKLKIEFEEHENGSEEKNR